MKRRKERNCQIRMSPYLWNVVGEIAHDLGREDKRGTHSAIIREMVAATAAKWAHSPYICRSSSHVFYVSREGNIFNRQIQVLKLNSTREKLPCFIDMKQEKREYYHERCRRLGNSVDEHRWLLSRWLLNYFAVWSGKRDGDDLNAFQEDPLDSHVDTFGTTYKSADLRVHSMSGRFLTREVTSGLRDYVQWKTPGTPVFDRVEVPIDIPTSNLEICVIVDQDLFSEMHLHDEEIANLSLEFRNRESARFEGKEVALLPEVGIVEQYGRSASDDGADEMLLKLRRLRQRVTQILDKSSNGTSVEQHSDRDTVKQSLIQPQHFLFYWLRWSAPHLGVEACVRWEKPLKPAEMITSEEGSKEKTPISGAAESPRITSSENRLDEPAKIQTRPRRPRSAQKK